MGTKTAGAVLLTGATGFLGSELLGRLLAGDDRDLICLVRANSPAEASGRGDRVLRAVLGREPSEAEWRRVRWVRADLEEPRLGMTRAEWAEVAALTEEIFHCAASTRFDLSLIDAHRINVDGVLRIHELAVVAARRGAFIRLHHVSTAYVAGKREGVVTPDFLPSDRARNFRNTYERTKARAERFLRQQDDVPVTIYRPSIVAGATVTGETTSWNVLYSPMRMIAKGSLSMMCSGGAGLVDTVAVDFVVDAIFALSRCPARRIEAHHLTAGRSLFDVEQFLERCYAGVLNHHPERAKRTKVVGGLRWSALHGSLRLASHAPKRLVWLRRRGRIGSKVLAGFTPYAPYTRVSTRFDVGSGDAWLAERGIEMPAGREYLDTIIDYALSTNFGRKPGTPILRETVA